MIANAIIAFKATEYAMLLQIGRPVLLVCVQNQHVLHNQERLNNWCCQKTGANLNRFPVQAPIHYVVLSKLRSTM